LNLAIVTCVCLCVDISVLVRKEVEGIGTASGLWLPSVCNMEGVKSPLNVKNVSRKFHLYPGMIYCITLYTLKEFL
jgi:hypothetical protein